MSDLQEIFMRLISKQSIGNVPPIRHKPKDELFSVAVGTAHVP